MKRSVMILATGAAALVAAAAAVPLSAGAASSSRPTVRLTLVESSDAFHVLDVPGAPEDGQAGDIITFESTLTKAGAKVGRLEGHCVQVRADGSLDDCGVTVTVGRNSFRMAGPFDPATGSPLTITGGTGEWVGAAGTDSIVNQPDGTAVHTITLVRP